MTHPETPAGAAPTNRSLRGGAFALALMLMFAALAVAGSALLGGGALSGREGDETAAALAREPAPLPRTGRLLILLIDSGRKDFLFSERMPFLASLRRKGVWGISEVLGFPLSISGANALFMGAPADLFAFLEDFQPATVGKENLFRRMQQRGGRVVIFGNSLRLAYGVYSDLSAYRPKHFLFAQYREEGEYVFQQAYRFLKNERWDLAVVPFYSADHLGHLETPHSEKYPSLLRQLDGYVRELVSLTTEQDVVFISSEHGMDDRGFHTDASELVVETPFVLLGPGVRATGPLRVLQIDWAPTLSLLAGLSPFYPTPALPAVELVQLSGEQRASLARAYARLFGGASAAAPSPAWEEVQALRRAHLGKQAAPVSGILAFVLVIFGAAFFAVAARAPGGPAGPSRLLRLLRLLASLGLLVVILGGALWLGLLDYLSNDLPFSANFILSHPFGVPLALILLAAAAAILWRALVRWAPSEQGYLHLAVVVVAFAVVYLAPSPYHPLNWLLLGAPLVAWGSSRRSAWLVLLGAFALGLAVRRLKFYTTFMEVSIGARWMLLLALFLVTLAYQLWRSQRAHRGAPGCVRDGATAALLGLPLVLLVALPLGVELRALFLGLALLPLDVASRRLQAAREVWLAFWVVAFYLGTSSSINHATHLVALPLLAAAWAAARGASATVRASLLLLAAWALYFLPGNSFDLRLLDLTDQFIIGSTTAAEVWKTVSVIAARQILPVAVLVGGLRLASGSPGLLPIIAAALLPAVLAIGLRLGVLVGTSSQVYPWEEYVRLIVLHGHVLVLLAAGIVAAVGRALVGGLCVERATAPAEGEGVAGEA
ncbi:MAG: alkaline phosphatase family protein [Candidatus Tectomicrobia bacterium]|nr:alkaline phosphatase family protein [Candidatus Tectomicrobia bacterium]